MLVQEQAIIAKKRVEDFLIQNIDYTIVYRVTLSKLGQVFKKTHVGQSWKKAKIHKNIANVASGLGKILEKKRLKKIFCGGVGARAAKKSQSQLTQRNRVSWVEKFNR